MDLRLRLLLLALPLARLALAAPASAQEGRDWKREPWYSPEKYPDAPFLRARAKAAGHRIIEPALGDIPSTATTPALRFMEFAVIDPDDHVISFFQYFASDEAWAAAQQAVRGLE